MGEQRKLCEKALESKITLREIDEMVARRKEVASSCTLRAAIDEFTLHKLSANGGKTSRHLQDLFGVMKRLVESIDGKTPITEINKDGLHEWLFDLEVGWKRRKDVRSYLVELWKWAWHEGYVHPENGLTAADRLPKIKSQATNGVRVLSPEEMRFILLNINPRWLPWCVLAGFSGLRSEEIRTQLQYKEALDWSNVDLKRKIIDLPATISKVRKRRIVPITNTLATWIKHINPPSSGPVCSSSPTKRETGRIGRLLDKHFDREEGWPQNALRHSYGSYRAALTRDLPSLSLEMGNSVAIVQRHYHEAQTVEQANAYFSLTASELHQNPKFRKKKNP